jgi:hypothetical protein
MTKRDGVERDGSERVLVLQADLAVRGLRAFAWRKRRVREELLAHLVMIHEEELARVEAPATALAATLERWGSAGEIGRELQSAVPMLERLATLPLPRLAALDGLLWKKGPRESTIGYAWRLAAWLTTASAVVGALAIGALGLFSRGPSVHPARGALDAAETFGAGLGALFASCFVVAMMFDRLGLRTRIEPESGLARPAKGAIVAGLVVGKVLSFLAFFAGALVALPSDHGRRLVELAHLLAPSFSVLGIVAVLLSLLFVVTTAVIALQARDDRSRAGAE